MKTLKYLGRLLKEFGGFAWHNKAWWIVPVVLVLLLLALVPLTVGLVLISVAIGSKKLGRHAKGLFLRVFSALMVIAGALIIASQLA